MPWDPTICIAASFFLSSHLKGGYRCKYPPIFLAAKIFGLRNFDRSGQKRNLGVSFDFFVYYIWISRNATMEQVAQYILDKTYFGDGLIGITYSAKRFFGKAPSELLVEETIFLLSIMESPTRACKIEVLARWKKEKANLLLEQKVINKLEMDKTILAPMPLRFRESCKLKAFRAANTA